MTLRARRPFTLYTVAGLPEWSTRDHLGQCTADHTPATAVGYVVVAMTFTGDHTTRSDVAAFDGGDEMSLRAASAFGTQNPMYVVDRVYACGSRTESALPAEHVERDSWPCEAGDGYLDPAVDSEVVCEWRGHMHEDCHAAVCQSRACFVANFGED